MAVAALLFRGSCFERLVKDEEEVGFFSSVSRLELSLFILGRGVYVLGGVLDFVVGGVVLLMPPRLLWRWHL